MVSAKPPIDTMGRYSVSQAAEVLGIHRTTIWRWVRKGWLTPVIRKVNNRVVFRGKDLLSAWESYI